MNLSQVMQSNGLQPRSHPVIARPLSVIARPHPIIASEARQSIPPDPHPNQPPSVSFLKIVS